MAMREILVRRFTWSVQTMGMGRMTKRKSVKMLIAGVVLLVGFLGGWENIEYRLLRVASTA
jgi:hypothetical protein